ncbi:MAG: DUF1963 domain-containing protein [Bacteroidota bacterium]
MDFLKRLFRFGTYDSARELNLTNEQAVSEPFVQNVLTKYRKNAVLLRPHTTRIQLAFDTSKVGGVADLRGFSSYPCCNKCSEPLNFVLQIYRKDFAGLYYPENKNLFQLFRCPNRECGGDQYSDQAMFVYYFTEQSAPSKLLLKPLSLTEDNEQEVPECELRSQNVLDYPIYDDYPNDEYTKIEIKYGDTFGEYFMENFSAKEGTKIGGYPAYTQSPVHPLCTCGKMKTFFFQLSSCDIEEGVNYPPPPDQWSAHGIMIGDVGNIYFYVCMDFGEKSIESNWDCY